ncbi:HlyD family efflux transporter periplasmic adaptor subunit [filamentous cyanobacterium LEGE 11480]|uniref:HlyD family efflux transporter periplasmic adaptor subunit n=1 Tax=Romeriopsis navalis LEGE 11480 TaxID=2777977 RepID=A0A928Z5A4_9CYAN|nr:HlyD family secretion protein [Romeriopsis navalis]MBE9031055.1 HlyD family efflux transporter periplasmic adaptor subunit [Romeriopsis navalis LEGE 11480]
MPELTAPHPTVLTPAHPDWELGLSEDWSASTQELLDTMPQRWSRSLLYTMVMFGSVVLPWAFLAEVDEVGTARGRLEPQGKTIRLDAPVAGTVARVNVKAGQTVKAGEALLALDTKLLQTELQQARDQLEGQLNRLVQLRLMQQQLHLSLRTQRLQYQAQIAEQESERNRAVQQLRYFEKSYAIAQQVLQKDAQRAVKFRRLFQQGIIAGIRADDAERTMLTTNQSLKQVQSEWAQAKVNLQKQRSTAERMRREGEVALLATDRQRKQAQAGIAQLQTEVIALRSQIKNLTLRIQQSQLKIPVEGTIFELPQQHAGAVVQPGQMLATIAPKGAPLVLRAQVTTTESGFLKVGLPVKIKLDAYPFQEYGVLPGKIRWISPNSKSPQTSQSGSEPASSDQAVFDVEIELAQTALQAGNRTIALKPGQTANAEIIIRQRRVADFFLDPFRKLQKGGMNF